MGFNTFKKNTFNGSLELEKYDVFYKQMYEMEAVEDNTRALSKSFLLDDFLF